jgi:hypothetical protein
MAKIKVTVGGCSMEYKEANGTRYALKTANDGAFECDDAQASRLVSLGVAEYAGKVPAAAPAAQPDAANQQDEETVTGHLDPEQLATMTNEQLKNLAGDLGIDVTGCKKKADYIDAIVAAEVEAGGIEDGDELPDLDAADPE